MTVRGMFVLRVSPPQTAILCTHVVEDNRRYCASDQLRLTKTITQVV